MNVIVRRVDKVGRIVLPMNYRRALGLDADSEVILGIEDGVITVKPCGEACKLCGSRENVNEEVSLSSACIVKIKEI